MGDTAQTKLEILIRTVADQQGIALTDSGLKQLSSSLGKSEAGTKAVSAASKELGGEFHHLSTAGKGAEQVLQGLERGGIGGMVESVHGLGRVISGLATGALGGVLLPALAAGGVAFYALRSIANEAAADLKRDYDEGIASIKRHTAALEANKVAGEISLRAQLKEVSKLKVAWEELDTAVEQSHTRTEKVNAAKAGTVDAKINLEEQQLLATAKTPAEKESIKRRIEGTRVDQKNKNAAFALDQEDSFATDNARAARTVINDSESKIRGSQQFVDDKQRAADAAKSRISDLPQGSNAQIEAIKTAKDAEDALKIEKENFTKTLAEMTTAIKAAEGKIDAANTTHEAVAEQRKTLAIDVASEATKRANETRERLTEARAHVAEASAPVAEAAGKVQAGQQKLAGLQDQKNKDQTFGGDPKLLAAIDQTKADNEKADAELAEAQKKLDASLKEQAIAQKEAAVAQLKQTESATKAQAIAAEKQLAAHEDYHKAVVSGFTAVGDRVTGLAKKVSEIAQSQRRLADAQQ